MTSANRAIYETFGGTEKDLKAGFNAWQLLSPENVDKSNKNIKRLLMGEKIEGTEYTLKRMDGSAFPAIVISSLIHSNGKPVGFRGAIVDITERKQAEKVLKETLDSLRKAVGVTIQVMVSAVETRDPYTAGHQVRSANLARTIATEMGLSQEKIDGIRVAGSIHDIGKLSIPAEILSKPTKLSEVEFSLIKEHARQGYEILKGVESSWPLAEMVYQHHERMDGSGYPRHLRGDEILPESRILAVADVVEAIASHRPYRPALGIEAALQEIEKNRGTLYDVAVADACLKLFREKGFQFEGT
jgi:PAS domain S-box-containing protein